MMPATLSIITNAFPPHERGKAIGTWAGVSALALAIGPVVGGFLTEHVSWRAIFFLNIPVAIAAVIVTLAATRESRDETVPRTVDYAGVATLTIGIGALVLALDRGQQLGLGLRPRARACWRCRWSGSLAFNVVELRSRNPMIEYRFFRSRTFLARTASPSASRSRCSPCSSSWRSTCRTSSATRRSRRASASSPPPS